MSLSSEMEKKPTEDDCVDSGAETAGSDFSPMSSTCSELSMGDVQDPFLVSVHIITDPGNSRTLQKAMDNVLAWIRPDLQLFRVSERGCWKKPERCRTGIVIQPSLAIILFLQEDYGEEQFQRLHQSLRLPPWQYHHTERVNGRILPYMPCNQDFFTLSGSTPLWAIRQVHYGKEIVRFTIYCSHENFVDMMKMYQLILKREVSQKKGDFCFFIVYSNMDMEIQLSLKRLPKDQYPTPTESAIIEFRVTEIGQLVPLLPNPCTPISDVRWQTEDYDGNKILLQVRSSTRVSHRWPTLSQLDPQPSCPAPATNTHHGRGPAFYRNKRYQKLQPPSRSKQHHRLSQQDLSSSCLGDNSSRRSSSSSETSWTVQRSCSLYCLPAVRHCPSQAPSLLSSSFSDRTAAFRFKIDALEDAEETDVDTGLKLTSSDMSVVSAYTRLAANFQSSSPDKVYRHPPRAVPLRTRPLSMHNSPLPSYSGLPCDSLPSLSDISFCGSSCLSSLKPQRPQSAFDPLHRLTPSALRHSGDSGHSTETESISLRQQAGSHDLPEEDPEQEFYI
ncbi:protein FAM124A [Polyodon spathula]|uniref:protein FAM124A n=1 Tax=Polyodon spathula TaxID=7913 RepID=UPI001B7DF97F|nr:protein FAM124A [Polyodon spathula]